MLTASNFESITTAQERELASCVNHTMTVVHVLIAAIKIIFIWRVWRNFTVNTVLDMCVPLVFVAGISLPENTLVKTHT